MSTEPALPLWLESANAHLKRGAPVGFPETGEWPLLALPGEIRAARSMDHEDARTRLVVVLETHTEDDPWVNACLVADASDIGGDRDVRLDPADTKLSFPTSVETDVVGPLFMVQLGPRLGRIESPILEGLKGAVLGQWASSLGGRRGIPIMGRHEARWRLKEQELAVMHTLGQPCLEHVLFATTDEMRKELVLDPAILREDVIGSKAMRLLTVLARVEHEGGALDVPLEALLENNHLEPWIMALGPDETRALELTLQRSLASEEPHLTSDGGAAMWRSVWAPPDGDTLARHLAGHARMGRRAFRVLTSASHWSRLESRIPPGAVMALDVEGVGRVQVKPELIEEAA